MSDNKPKIGTFKGRPCRVARFIKGHGQHQPDRMVLHFVDGNWPRDLTIRSRRLGKLPPSQAAVWARTGMLIDQGMEPGRARTQALAEASKMWI